MGRLVEAEAEYAEIIARESNKPWGFMKRALFHAPGAFPPHPSDRAHDAI